jgi:ABC-type transporter Mla subunit MlaD
MCASDSQHNDHPDKETTAIFIVSGTDASAEVERLTTLLKKTRPTEIFCDVGGLPPGLDSVDTIARLQLSAARANVTLKVSRAPAALIDLLVAVGLDHVVAYGV